MIILDAYAIVAYLRDETAAADVSAMLSAGDTATTTLAVAETVDRLVRGDGFDADDVIVDLADLGLLPAVEVSTEIGLRAARLRAAHYHRTTRAVSLADCVAAATAAQHGWSLATADPHLLDLCHAEGIDVSPLLATDGSAWQPRDSW